MHREALYNARGFKGLRWRELNERIISCNLCPRLVDYRVSVAGLNPRFRGEVYWSKPVLGFGDSSARIIIVGLAPAAHGGNRVGRVFTGDESSQNLMRALYDAGLANQPYSISNDDGLKLFNTYITASVKCAPPKNKPLPSEINTCRRYLVEELRLIENARVYVALGAIAWNSLVKSLEEIFKVDLGRVGFKHGLKLFFKAEDVLRWAIASYHPSPHNVRTGRLSLAVLEEVFREAKMLAGI